MSRFALSICHGTNATNRGDDLSESDSTMDDVFDGLETPKNTGVNRDFADHLIIDRGDGANLGKMPQQSMNSTAKDISVAMTALTASSSTITAVTASSSRKKAPRRGSLERIGSVLDASNDECTQVEDKENASYCQTHKSSRGSSMASVTRRARSTGKAVSRRSSMPSSGSSGNQELADDRENSPYQRKQQQQQQEESSRMKKQKRCQTIKRPKKQVRFSSSRKIHLLKAYTSCVDDMPTGPNTEDDSKGMDDVGVKESHMGGMESPTSASCTVTRLPTNLNSVDWFCSTKDISESCSRTFRYMITGEMIKGRGVCGTGSGGSTFTTEGRDQFYNQDWSDFISKDAEVECARGLLTPKLKTRRFETRRVAWNAVLEEQSQQNQSGITDPESIAEQYRSCCKLALQKARDLALQDQEDATEFSAPPGSKTPLSARRRRRRGRSPVRGI